MRLICFSVHDPDVGFGDDNQAVDVGLGIRRVFEAQKFLADAPDFLRLRIEAVRGDALAGEPVFDIEHFVAGGLYSQRQERK